MDFIFLFILFSYELRYFAYWPIFQKPHGHLSYNIYVVIYIEVLFYVSGKNCAMIDAA